MKFRTEIATAKAPFTLNPACPAVMVGSCFSENMAAKMNDCLWTAENPLGTLYNPVSIADALRMCLRENSEAFSATLFKDGCFHHSWAFDSSFSGRFERECISQFRRQSARLKELMGNAGVLFVTFGSAWVYRLKDKNNTPIVGNCHKQPAENFIRTRLSIQEIVEIWSSTLNSLSTEYPQLKVIFTVSPVRHLRDGAEANSCSKAILLLAVEELCKKNDNASYFPAYEIMTDDLRDYRFYDSDLVHPSAEGIEYIWEHIKAAYIDSQGMDLLKEGESIIRMIRHRPLIPETEVERAVRMNKIEARMDHFHSRQRIICPHEDKLRSHNESELPR